MAKGRAEEKARPTRPAPAATGANKPVGPPMLLVVLGYASLLASLPLVGVDGVGIHILGYVAGALIPILVIGVVRRVDLDRRRSPYYVPRPGLPTALVVLAIAAVIAAGLHVWPIATELAS